MREIIAKIVVLIDGKEYEFKTCNYSETIDQAIKDEIVSDDVDDIMQYIYFDSEF